MMEAGVDAVEYRSWLSAADTLSPAQRQEAVEVLQGRPAAIRVVEAIETRVDPDRHCPHCAMPGAVSRGHANGLRRFRCNGCGKSFNALTGTSLAGLRLRDRWWDFAECLRDGDTVESSAEVCGVASSTAFRWRHRFLRNATAGATSLCGIVEADETFFLFSRKGERQLDRPARRRGGKAGKPGLSKELVPVLVAADRSGATLSAVLPEVNSAEIEAVLKPVLAADALLVTDGGSYYRKVANDLGVSHEALNQSAGERIRGDLHIQTVNSRHQQLKDFVRSFRGVAAKYLPNYVRWFHIAALMSSPTPQSCLNAALAFPAQVAMPS